MLYKLGDRVPKLLGEHFIAPTATLIGSVVLENNASVWFGALLRADGDLIHVGEGSNIQDGAVLHADPGFPLHLGKRVTVGHKALLHGCRIGDECLIGMNALVLNGASIGKGCLIGANALVTEGMEVPDGSVVLGSPGRIVRTLEEDARRKLAESALRYIENARRYRQQLRPMEAYPMSRAGRAG